jgi:hypothetical protein
LTIRDSIGVGLVALGGIGLVASRGQTLTLSSGPFVISAGSDVFIIDHQVWVSPGVLVVLVAIGLAVLFWSRGRKASA